MLIRTASSVTPENWLFTDASKVGGTISTSIFVMMQGVQMIRVHDVNEINQSIKVFKQLIK